MTTSLTEDLVWYQNHFNTLSTEHFEYLKDIALRYAKYQNLFTCFGCYPQRQGKNYDPTERPHFIFQVNDPTEPQENEVWFTVKPEGVTIDYQINLRGDLWKEEHIMTHAKCFEYLDQLPKSWHHFTVDD